ncbi:MAG: phosphotransferase family protein [Chloroflexota bacterium]
MTFDASIDDLRQKLENFITEQTGAEVRITGAKPLAGGASRESWALTVAIDEVEEALVMRKDMPTTMNEQALTRRQEFTLMQAAYDAGVRVARMRFLCEDPDVLGLPFFLMDFVPGVSIGTKVIRDPALEHARSVLPEQMAEQLAIIHSMQVDHLDFLQGPPDSLTHAQAVVQATRQVLDDLGLHVPAFEYALRWAEQHAPTDEPLTFAHGDFRIGNLLVDENGLAAVIDWEFAHLGSPAEELGYLCMRDWRFGNDHLHAAGLCPRERLIRAYEAASGRAVDRDAVDWWEIMGNIRWGVICLSQANRHLSGEDPSVELASLGRRSAEMQLEALRLIEKVGL